MIERNKKWIKENPERALAIARRSRLRRVYGITPEEYDALAAKQKNACAICKQECVTGYRLAVDHDHETGRVRGLLCMHCNSGIGNLNDSIPLLQAAIRYLSHPV